MRTSIVLLVDLGIDKVEDWVGGFGLVDALGLERSIATA